MKIRTSGTIRRTEEEITVRETEGPGTPVSPKETEHLRLDQKTTYPGGHLQRGLTSRTQKTEPLLKHQKLEERH